MNADGMNDESQTLAEAVAEMEEKGLRPVQVGPNRFLAICPCCGKVGLIVEGPNSREGEPPSNRERGRWHRAQRGRRSG